MFVFLGYPGNHFKCSKVGRGVSAETVWFLLPWEERFPLTHTHRDTHIWEFLCMSLQVSSLNECVEKSSNFTFHKELMFFTIKHTHTDRHVPIFYSVTVTPTAKMTIHKIMADRLVGVAHPSG